MGLCSTIANPHGVAIPTYRQPPHKRRLAVTSGALALLPVKKHRKQSLLSI